ncbi:hypothetical protein JCM10450v2_007902 [Rhodotorula kratochvilovae]
MAEQPRYYGRSLPYTPTQPPFPSAPEQPAPAWSLAEDILLLALWALVAPNGGPIPAPLVPHVLGGRSAREAQERASALSGVMAALPPRDERRAAVAARVRETAARLGPWMRGQGLLAPLPPRTQFPGQPATEVRATWAQYAEYSMAYNSAPPSSYARPPPPPPLPHNERYAQLNPPVLPPLAHTGALPPAPPPPPTSRAPAPAPTPQKASKRRPRPSLYDAPRRPSSHSLPAARAPPTPASLSPAPPPAPQPPHPPPPHATLKLDAPSSAARTVHTARAERTLSARRGRVTRSAASGARASAAAAAQGALAPARTSRAETQEEEEPKPEPEPEREPEGETALAPAQRRNGRAFEAPLVARAGRPRRRGKVEREAVESDEGGARAEGVRGALAALRGECAPPSMGDGGPPSQAGEVGGATGAEGGSASAGGTGAGGAVAGPFALAFAFAAAAAPPPQRLQPHASTSAQLGALAGTRARDEGQVRRLVRAWAPYRPPAAARVKAGAGVGGRKQERVRWVEAAELARRAGEGRAALRALAGVLRAEAESG